MCWHGSLAFCLVFGFLCDARPNFLIFLADDMGYADLASYGHPVIRTPNLDRLALGGVRMTQFLVEPECTPTRAALLTGRYPRRSGMASSTFRTLKSPADSGGLPHEELTFAELLKERGYATGYSGKWHLGLNRLTNTDSYWNPIQHGYDTYLGHPISNSQQSCRPGQEAPGCMMYRDDGPIQQPMRIENTTLQLAYHAIDFIQNAVSRNESFLYFLSWFTPHTALYTSPAFAGRSEFGPYGDVIEELDYASGQVIDEIDRLGIGEDTVIIFMSDNGPYLEEGIEGGSKGSLTGGKGQIWEGGIRVPAIFRWTNHIQQGAVTDVAAHAVDIFPTLLNFANIPVPIDRHIDGVDLSAVLADGAQRGNDLYFHHCGEELMAMRVKNFKIHFQTTRWTSQDMDDPPCQQCCPYDPNGPGYGVCRCVQSCHEYPTHGIVLSDSEVGRASASSKQECCALCEETEGCEAWEFRTNEFMCILSAGINIALGASNPNSVIGAAGSLDFHDPPLLYNMDTDPNERFLLTRDNFPQFDEIISIALQERAAHLQSLDPQVVNQLDKPMNPLLYPCCDDPLCTCFEDLPFNEVDIP